MGFDPISYILAKKRGITWEEVKNKLASEGAINVLYDTDKDNLVDKLGPESVDLTKIKNLLGYDWVAAVDVNNAPTIAILSKGLGVKLDDVTATEPAIGCVTTVNVGIDAHIRAWVLPRDRGGLVLRVQGQLGDVDCYLGGYIDLTQATADFMLYKRVAGAWTLLASEAVDLSKTWHDCIFSISGSTLKASRDGGSTFSVSATDTDISADGRAGLRHSGLPDHPYFVPISIGLPYTRLPKAIRIIECEITGSGKNTEDDPIRPLFKKHIVTSNGKKYDKLSVTWGSFDYKKEFSTMLCIITGDNPYQQGAILEQESYAKSKNLKVLKPPRDYLEAKQQYQELKKEFPNWLAGLHNWCYQTIGYEDFEAMQAADMYYGELIEHKTHYIQLKRVPDWKIRKYLNMWKDRLKKGTILAEEREKHLRKLEEIERLGW